MKKTSKFNFKTSFVLLLSLLLCLTTGLSVACDTKDSSLSSSSTTEEVTYPTDYQTVTNGDFEFSTFTKENDKFPVSSSIGWTQSRDSITTSAPSSTYNSGIINTEETAYNAIAEKAGFDEVSEGVYYNPHTPAYYGLVENEYVNDENTENEDGIPTNGSKILMIHNQTAIEGEGTAQKFSSSTSLTLAKHEYAKVSVWVSTHALTSNVEGVDYGAYIAIQNTVASTTTPFIIKNINTNDSWVKYTVYLESSDFATSSFKVVLGLGFGSSKIRREFVEGFAYFDNVHYEVIDKAEYEEGVQGANEYNLYALNGTEYEINENLTANEKGASYTDTTAYTKQDAFNANNAFTNTVFSLSHARASLSGVNTATFNVESNKNDLAEGQADGVATSDTLANALTAIGGDVKAPFEGIDNASTIYFNHTAPTSYSVTIDELEVDANAFFKLSFWVKADVEYKTQRALSITLNDLGAGSSDPVKTVIASNVTTEDDENENFNGWREYIVYVNNVVEGENGSTTRKFSLTFDFGITERKELTDGNWSLTKGYAIVTAFEAWVLTEDDYNNADTSNYQYAKKVSLTADLPNGVEGENKDSYKFTYGATDNVAIENGVASNVMGYTGVVGNSKAVGGENDNTYSNENITAGVINTEYLANYVSNGLLTDAQKTAIEALEKGANNDYLQALMIKNSATADGVTYGFFGSSATLSANTTSYITVDVKVLGNASAYIYLANSNALDGFEVLKLNAKAYTYSEANGVEISENYAVSKDFAIEITEGDCADGWFTVKIMITTGDNAISYRPEFWLGARDGSNAKDGVVLFDNYNVTTSKTATALKQELKLDGDTVATEEKYTRMPTKVLTTDDKGNEVVSYKTNYAETVVFATYTVSKSIIADYSTIDVVNEIDNTTATEEDDDHDHDHSESSQENSFSWALQITSIIIVVVLIALLVVVIIRTIMKNRGSKKQAKASYYSANSREAAGMKAEERKAKRAKADAEKLEQPAEEPEVAPYDYDNMENNIVNDEVAEETSETAQEESQETAEEQPAEGETESEEQPE